MIDPVVLRRMVQERLQLYLRGEIPKAEFRGYLTAMFHAGVISEDELRDLAKANVQGFTLTPPEST